VTTNHSRTVESTSGKISALIAIKILGALFATLVFARFSPLVDSKLYLSGYYAIDPLLRTQLIHKLAITLNSLGGAFFAHVVFGLISTAGLIYYFATGGRRWIFVWMLLLPSSLVWTSIVGKEALYFGCFNLLLVIWSKYVVAKLNLLDLLAACMALGICGLLRPHYGVAIVWLFFSTGIIKKLGSKAWPVLLATIIVAALAVYFYVWSDLLYRGFGGIEASARSSRFVLFDMVPNSDSGFDHFRKIVLLGFIVGIVGPLPSELLTRPEFLPFFLEGVLILLSPIFIYRYASKQEFIGTTLFLRIYWWCLVPAIISIMILHAPFGLLNPGSASRWRTNFEALFYMAPLLLLFRFTDYNRYEDTSLSP